MVFIIALTTAIVIVAVVALRSRRTEIELKQKRYVWNSKADDTKQPCAKIGVKLVTSIKRVVKLV